MKHIISTGPFVYYIIQEVWRLMFVFFVGNNFTFQGCLNWYMFSQQHVLALLAQFILRAYVAMSRNKKAPTMPLIISAPKDNESGMCIVMGIPPICENSPKKYVHLQLFPSKQLLKRKSVYSLFGKAFEQAAERTNCDSQCDFFDTACEYRSKQKRDLLLFFNCLTDFEIHTKHRTRFLDALTALLS